MGGGYCSIKLLAEFESTPETWGVNSSIKLLAEFESTPEGRSLKLPSISNCSLYVAR